MGMKIKGSISPLWTSLGFLLALLFSMPAIAADDKPSGAKDDPFPKPTPTTAQEPLASQFSPARAAEYLDRSAIAWLRARDCSSCHSSYSYLMARPLLGDLKAPALLQIRKYVEDRIAGWDQGGQGKGLPDEDDEAVTEVVATGATLAFYDAQTTKKLNPLTRKALDRMWTLQRADGSWNWNKHQLAPQELDEYYGAVFAAVGVGHAPDRYAQGESATEGLARLKRYLRQNQAPNLHHKTLLLWASLKLDDLMTPPERKQTIKDLLALQRKDGGWNLPSLGDWKRQDGKPNDKDADSDGYATGLVVYVLRQAGMEVKEDAIQRGVHWLKTNQRTSGRWFTRSLNADRAHFITNAGTAYAMMALRCCDALDK